MPVRQFDTFQHTSAAVRGASTCTMKRSKGTLRYGRVYFPIQGRRDGIDKDHEADADADADAVLENQILDSEVRTLQGKCIRTSIGREA